MIASYKEKLLTKSKKEYFPHLIWIAPPLHKYFPDNVKQWRFTEALDEAVQSTQSFALSL